MVALGQNSVDRTGSCCDTPWVDDAEYAKKYTERFVLLAELGRGRRSVVRAAEGLSEQELRRAGVSSGTSLLGIVYHLTGVEQHWFPRVFLGERLEPDKSMTVPEDLSSGQVIEAYEHACQRSDEIVRGCSDLSARAAIPNPGEQERDSLRVILSHMVEETARHAG